MVNLKTLSSDVCEKLPYKETKSKVEGIVESTFENLVVALENGEEIRIKGLGTFKVIKTKGVKRKLPGASEVKSYPGKKKVKFTPSSKLSL